MKIVSGYYVYKVWFTLNLHFNNRYDFSKRFTLICNDSLYNKFKNSKQIQFSCDSLAKKLKTKQEVISFFIFVLKEDSDVWINSIFYKDYEDSFRGWKNMLTNFPYLFKLDSQQLLKNGLLFDESLGIFVLNSFLDHKIKLETFFVYKQIFKFNLNGIVEYDYDFRPNYENYGKLFSIDKKKYKRILKEVIKNI